MNPKQDKLFNASLIALLAIYAVLTQAAQLTGSVGLPQFDNIFAGPRPAEVSGYTVRVTALDGEILSEPTTVKSSLVTDFGIAFYEGAWEEVERLRGEFEAMMAENATSAEYELILRVINPVERYSMTTNVAEQILSTFTFNQTVAQFNTDS